MQSGLPECCSHLWKGGDNERSEIEIEKGARIPVFSISCSHISKEPGGKVNFSETLCALLANAKWKQGET